MITNSLAAKNALVYFLLFIFGIGLLSIILLNYSSTEIIKGSHNQLTHQSELVTIKFQEAIEELKKDITFLSYSSALANYVYQPNPDHTIILEEEFYALIKAKKNYNQIRYISKIERGKEMIRVDRIGEKIKIAPDKNLQFKGNRAYFSKTIELPKDSLYISPIDLNKEYGKISQPATPTLRAGFPVYSNDSIKGIIVINYDLRELFSALQQMIDKDYNIQIANQDGYYILHNELDSTFLFEYNKPPQIQRAFNKSIQEFIQNDKKLFHYNNQIFNTRVIQLKGADYPLILFNSIDEDQLFKPYYQWRNNSFIFISCFGILFMTIAYQILKKQTKNLSKITKKITNFPQTLKVEDLPIRRKDEIGQLSRGLEEMSVKLVQTLENLNEAKTTAENAVLEKQQFLENFSHELRNPLQSILGITKILEANAKQPELQGIIQNLKFNTSNLNLLLNDILDYRQVINQNIILNPEWINIDYFFGELYKSNQYFAMTKRLEFNLEIAPELKNKDLFVDGIRLGQIINNLITNAIKYTPTKGSVTVQLELNKDQNLLFKVSDNGPGILDSDLIQRRYAMENSKNSTSMSHGIGLDIVTNLLKKMGSELKISSTANRGSTFSFLLQNTVRSSATQIDSDFQVKKINFCGASMLIIEDDEQIIDLYQHAFNQCNLKIDMVRELSQLDTLNKKYDILIADYKIGKTNIEQHSNQIKALLHPRTITYLASGITSGLEHLVDLIRLKTVFSKPFDIEKMRDHIFNDYCLFKFGTPNFDSIRSDYDYHFDKYSKAFRILYDEWIEVKSKLVQAIQLGDDQTFEEIRHKIITSVRRLELEEFEELLYEIDFKDFNSLSHQSELINVGMQYYLNKIEKLISLD